MDATTLGPLRAVRTKCTRHRCQPALLSTPSIARLSAWCAPLVISLTPQEPWAASPLRNRCPQAPSSPGLTSGPSSSLSPPASRDGHHHCLAHHGPISTVFDLNPRLIPMRYSATCMASSSMSGSDSCSRIYGTELVPLSAGFPRWPSPLPGSPRAHLEPNPHAGDLGERRSSTVIAHHQAWSWALVTFAP